MTFKPNNMKSYPRRYQVVADNVRLDNEHGRNYVTATVHVKRGKVRRFRNFLFTKFGGKALAIKKAIHHAKYLKTCTIEQFNKATRRVGRPLQSEYFGRRLINN